MTVRNPKTIWIVNHYTTIPRRDGAGARHFRLAQELSMHGWRSVLLLASTQHPSGKQHPTISGAVEIGDDSGVTYAMLRAPSYRGGIQRMLNMLWFAVKLLTSPALRRLPKPDMVMGSTVHLLAAWSAHRLARRNRVPFIFEIRDVWPETLIDLGKLRRDGLAASLMRRLSRHLCASADLIVSPLPRADRYLEELGLADKTFAWVSNGVDLSGNEAPERSDPSDDFVLMYLGSQGNANGVANLLRAFDMASELPGTRQIRLRLIGDGTQQEYLKRLSAGLSSRAKIQFEDRVPRSQVLGRAGEADALVVNVEDLPVYRFGISLNKLFDYMSSGRPTVIATNAPENPIVESGAGLSVAANDLEALAAAIRRISETTSEERAEMGARGVSYVRQNYLYSVLGEKFARALNDVRVGGTR